MFVAPGQNPLLLNNPQPYKCVVSMTPLPPPAKVPQALSDENKGVCTRLMCDTGKPVSNVVSTLLNGRVEIDVKKDAYPALPVETLLHILSFQNPIDAFRMATPILTGGMVPQWRKQYQWAFNDHFKRYNHDWIITQITNVPEDDAQRVNNATLCKNMDKASPSILTLQFRSSQGTLLPDTVKMRATIRRHDQGLGTHDPREMRPLSQWFVDLQELTSDGSPFNPMVCV